MSVSAKPEFPKKYPDTAKSLGVGRNTKLTRDLAPALRPLRIGVLGLGFGLGYFREYIGEDRKRVDIRAVCDSDSERLSSGVKAFGCTGYSDLESMLQDSEVDVIGVFSGPNGRANLIDQCVDAGKHVMTTKPLEVDPAAIESSLRRASEKGCHVFLNSPSPVLGEDMLLIRRWQEEFDLGELVFARSDCWYQALESADGCWYDDPAKCPVAPIFRLGIYGLNDVLALNREVVDIQVAASRMKTGRPTPDIAQMTLTLGNGAIATIRASWRSRPQRDLLTAEFVFENGVVQRTFGGLDHWDADPIRLALRCENSGGEIIETEAQIPFNRTNCAYRWDVMQRLIAGDRVENLISFDQTIASVSVLAELKSRFSQAGVLPSVL
ncbi:MAG: Gfo/Idh/MocA family oxidoreductase [Planctomycetota bacterium]